MVAVCDHVHPPLHSGEEQTPHVDVCSAACSRCDSVHQDLYATPCYCRLGQFTKGMMNSWLFSDIEEVDYEIVHGANTGSFTTFKFFISYVSQYGRLLSNKSAVLY